MTEIKIAFQTWENGGTQFSGIYKGEEAKAFVERHYESGTFATLHAFDDEAEGEAAYEQLIHKATPAIHPITNDLVVGDAWFLREEPSFHNPENNVQIFGSDEGEFIGWIENGEIMWGSWK